MTDFLWHEVDEKEKADIQQEAKKIMDDFSKKLSKVSKLKEAEIERPLSERKELENANSLNIDKDIMLKNAPESKNDFIVSEKGEW